MKDRTKLPGNNAVLSDSPESPPIGTSQASLTPPAKRMLLATYVAVSFLSLFAVTYFFQSAAYDNLARSKSVLPMAGLEEHWEHHWYANKSTLEIPSLMIPYEMRFEKLTGGSLVVWLGALIGIAVLTGKLAFKWFDSPVMLSIPTALYVIIPLVVSKWVYRDVFGMQAVCFIYLSLLLTIRGSLLFNPHLKNIDLSRSLGIEAVKVIIKTYQQFIITSLTAIAVISTTFLFGLGPAVRDHFKLLEPVFPAIEPPIHHFYVTFIILGIFGLVLGVTREFHVKLHALINKMTEG